MWLKLPRPEIPGSRHPGLLDHSGYPTFLREPSKMMNGTSILEEFIATLKDDKQLEHILLRYWQCYYYICT